MLTKSLEIKRYTYKLCETEDVNPNIRQSFLIKLSRDNGLINYSN